MELLTVPEAARRLKLGRSTVYGMAERGELPAVKFRRSIRIPSEELDKWLHRNLRGVPVDVRADVA